MDIDKDTNMAIQNKWGQKHSVDKVNMYVYMHIF